MQPMSIEKTMKRNLRNIFVLLFAVPLLTLAASPSKEKFLKNYNASAKEMVPSFETSSCKQVLAKTPPGRSFTTCRLTIENSFLSVESIDSAVTAVLLVFDSTYLEHPSDLTRSGGMLLRSMRGTYYGDYLATAMKVFQESKNTNWKRACTFDKESSSEFCIGSEDGILFSLAINRKP